DEVFVVDPRHELAAVAEAAAETAADQADERIEHTARIGAQGHRGAQRDLSRALGDRLRERLLPRQRDVDAEPPRARRGCLTTAEDTGSLVVRRVVAVRVNRRGARLEPDARRLSRARDRLGDDAG